MNFRKLFNSILILIFLFTFWSIKGQELSAQSRHITSATFGLGGGGTAFQDLYHANFINPANLMLNHRRRPGLTIGIAGGISAQGGGSLANISSYNQYLTGGFTLSDQLADDFITDTFGINDINIRSYNLDVAVIPVGAVLRTESWTISLAMRTRVLSTGNFSRGFADLVFRGLDADVFTEPRAVNTQHEAFLFTEISLGFATGIWQTDSFLGIGNNVTIYGGVAPKVILAHAYSTADLESDLRIQSASANGGAEIQHNFRYRFDTIGDLSEQLAGYNTERQLGTDPDISDFVTYNGDDISGIQGTSLGVDAGLTAEIELHTVPVLDKIFKGRKQLRMGFSVTDIGTINVTDRANRFEAGEDFLWKGFNYDSEIIDEEFDGDEGKFFQSILEDSIGTDIYGNFVTNSKDSFSRSLPTMINIGSHLIVGKFSLMMDVGRGFTDREINTKNVHLTLGSEYKIVDIIPIRIGYRTGGFSSDTFHAGIGLEFKNFEFSVAAASSSNSQNNGTGLGFAISGLVFHL